MSTPEHGIVAIPRTVLSVAFGVIDTVERAVVGDARVRTARGNAWEAVCADRARAAQLAALRQQVTQLSVGSSPLSSASQAPVAPAEVGSGARS
jgi:hypothetical protein